MDAIEAVNWSAIPNPTGHGCDDPQRVAHALRLLTVSTTANQTGDAASLLAGSGFVCGHAAMVFPAAYAATPILLDLLEHGRRPRIKDAALALLSDALDCYPAAGHNRVDTAYGTGVPLCCAIARLLRGRSSALLTHGARGKRLLRDAELHWRLVLQQTEPQPDGTVTAIAALEGTPPHTPTEAELHTPRTDKPTTPTLRIDTDEPTTPTLRIDTLSTDTSAAAWVRLTHTPSPPPPGSALHPAECGLREH
ncbi:hypothetical protein JK361_35750 [Streptomyces sp. 5-8]|uniref:Uncharacterized protein n=1 Tax=Streptomyces musisoli TaxID=2802280 RepID=A0ABS1PBY2_9ACTN|nr:hypothetical protein [Streptomyces musisoli]MBL1109866.1 hypothetical protein [Streptomyces musisoli]